MDLLRRLGKLNNTAQNSTEQVLVSTLTTVIEMLHDRGYTNVQACQSIDEITTNMSEGRHVVSGGGSRSLHVFFHNDERVGVKQLRAWVEASLADNIIVVSLEGPTAFTRREAETTCPQVQFFTFRELCVNITRHVLVPKHEKVLDVAEMPVALSESMAELPVLWTSDKVAQYYAFEVNDVIRITRTAGVQEPLLYWRIVRPPPAS